MSNLKSTEECIKQSIEVHGEIYDYTKSVNLGVKIKTCIICHKINSITGEEHGEFWQTFDNHINNKRGCPRCSGLLKTTDDIISECINTHGDIYQYNDTIYKGKKEKIEIFCPIEGHGTFWQFPDNHIKGHGCPKCVHRYKTNSEEFIEKAIKIHGDKYDYSKVVYVNAKSKVCIICRKCGKYFWQTPNKHLLKQGCVCHKQTKLELEIENFLIKNNIKYEVEKTFKWLKNIKTNNLLRLDFFLPEYNIAIECQGIQHFKPVKWFGGEKGLKQTQNRDKIKKELCEQNNIKILYYNYNKKTTKKLEDILNEYKLNSM